MKIESRRDLELLEAISQDERITQRTLASQLGMALGLANIYLKRLVRKGFVKCVNVQSNRILYLVTPMGIAEKTRLTYEFMEYSLHLYAQVRQHLRTVLAPIAEARSNRVAIYGSGEAAELAYLALKELRLDPVGIYDGRGEGVFLGFPVRRLHDAGPDAYDLLIVATLDSGNASVTELIRDGIPPEKLLPLRPPLTSQELGR